MATSQFANGKLEIMKKQNEMLALPGGYNAAGELSQDPGEILSVSYMATHSVVLSRAYFLTDSLIGDRETKRALPIGFWKGSGLTIVLDMIAAALAGGQSTHEIHAQGAEYAVSQVCCKSKLAAHSALCASKE